MKVSRRARKAVAIDRACRRVLATVAATVFLSVPALAAAWTLVR